MNEQTSSVQASPDMTTSVQWLSVKEASELFFELELPRNPRSVRRYCSSEDPKLECVKTLNKSGVDEYRINRDSVSGFIAEQKSVLGHMSGDDRSTPDMPGHDRVVNKEDNQPDNVEDIDGHARSSEPVQRELYNLVVDQLEKKDQQLERKDSQIETLNNSLDMMGERVREGNILLQNFQQVDSKNAFLDKPDVHVSQVSGSVVGTKREEGGSSEG